jgi:hypothetical protein
MRIDTLVHLLKEIRTIPAGQSPEELLRNENLLAHHHPEAVIRPEIIILAGKGGKLSRKEKEDWMPFLVQLLSGFEGTVISGGTNSGIPGLAGEIALDYLSQEKKAFHLIGYLPGKLPPGMDRSPGYDQFITSPKDDFSLEDILNYWVDILFRGILPENVLLTGISGGPLAFSEYQLALALGAKVTLLRDSGGSVKKIMEDPFWNTLPNLMLISPQRR